MPDSITSVHVNTENGISIATIKLKNGKVRTMPVEEAIKKGYPVPPPPPPPPPSAPPATEKQSNAPFLFGNAFTNGNEPLIVYAGLEITSQQLNQIDPDNIAKVEILKNENALAKYGEKARYGAIIITPKVPVNPKESKGNGDESFVMGQKLNPTEFSAKSEEKVVMGHQLKTDNIFSVPHDKTKSAFPEGILIILDGNEIERETLQGMDPSNIENINVLTAEKAIAKYGQKGENGALEIFTDKSGFNKIFTKTEVMPKFPGGMEAWRMHLSKNLRYPQTAIDKGIQGEAHVSFKVNVFGNLSEFEIVKDPGAGLGEEAVRLLKAGPDWEPAMQNGKIVNARTVQVVTFRLE
jgi:TonB family protein